MDYLSLIRFVVSRPMYLFTSRDGTLTPIESLLAKRREWIWIAAEAEKASIDYINCLLDCDEEDGEEDQERINIIRCDHNGLSYADHRINLEGAENVRLSTITHIDTIGRKIEKLMRKQNRAKV